MSEPEAKVKYRGGDAREDGKVFWAYKKGAEIWITKAQFDRRSETARKWREKNAERLREYARKQWRENPDKKRQAGRKWASKNRDRLREKRRQRGAERRDKIRERARKWREENRERVREQDRKWREKRIASDPQFKLLCRLRQRISTVFRRANVRKPSGIESILGISVQEAKDYLESQFKQGMSWENYGKWHVDHVIPLASAKTPEDLIKLCHYTNLQPLWAIENILKRDKLPEQTEQEKA
jgi:hypothetical protein